MNEANERDPFNNNCYGTLVDRALQAGQPAGPRRASISTSGSSAATRRATAEKDLPADLSLARSLVPAGTATLRDFSNISPEIPEYIPENCTGCMDCVTECPDTAILGKVLARDRVGGEARGRSPTADREHVPHAVVEDQEVLRRRQEEGRAGGMFQIIIDPTKCKGCAECVTVCDDNALKMIAKTDEMMTDVAQEPPLLQEHRPDQQASTSTTTCSST